MKNIDKIDEAALLELCQDFDREYGKYPDHVCEGKAVYSFYLRKKQRNVEESEVKE